MNDDLILKMILDESGFTAGMNSAVKKLGSFDNTISDTSKRSGNSLGSIWKVFAGSFLASGVSKIVGFGFNLIRDSISGAIDRVDTMNNAVRNFQNMGFEDAEITRTIGKNGTLSKGIQGLPTSLNDAISHVQLLASSTDDLGRSDQIFRALNDGILGFGGTTDQVNEAVIQLSQSFSNGKVDAQTWNSMINAQLGPTLAAIAKKMGMTMGDLKTGLSEGTVSVKDFQNQLIEMDTKGGGGLKSLNQIAKDSTKGIKTSVQNAKTAITRGVGGIIEGLNKALVDADLGGFKGIIDNFGKTMESFLGVVAANIPKAVELLGSLFKVLSKFGSVLKFLLPVLVPAATAFGAFMFQLKGIPTIIMSFNNLKAAITGIGSSLKIMGAIAAANPFVLIVGAIVGAIAVFGYFMATNEEFRSKVIGIWNDVKETVLDALVAIKEWGLKTWDSIKETASNAVQGVKDAWTGVKQWFSDLWSGAKDVANDFWVDTVDSAKSAAQGIKDAWSDTKQWFSDLWEGIKDTAGKTWASFSDAIMPYISPIVDGITNAFSNVKEGLATIFSEIGEIAGNAFEILKNIILTPALFVTSMISGGWEETKNNMLGVWNNIAEAAGNIWLSIQTIITTYFTMLVNSIVEIATGWYLTLANIFTGIKDWAVLKVIEMAQGVKNWWSNLVTSVKTFANDLKNSAIQAFENMKSGAIQRAIDLKNGAVNAWEDLKNSVKQKATDLKNGAINTWQALKTNVINTANNLVTGAENAWTNLKNGVLNTVDRVKNIFDTLRNINLFEIGSNIIQGLIDGISEKANAVVDKVKSIAGGIKTTITKALHIKSPSRWMRDMVGKNIVQGIIVGLDKEQPKLDQTMEGLVTTPDVRPTVQAAVRADGLSPSKNVQSTQSNEIHLHLTVYGDMPDSVIRQMAKKMKTELTRQMKRDADATGGALYAN